MQLFGLDWPINSVEELLPNKEKLIENTHNNDAKAATFLCLIKCLEHQEEEALELLPKITNKEQKRCLGQLILNYFYNYKLLTNKLNQNKLKGDLLYQKALEYSGLSPDPTVGITLGASLIVKNEEKFLENCLKSLQGVVDEIVVVDTGSTDRTVEIAKKYNAKIGYFEWCNDFSAARNVALSLNTTHWILCIDADETLDKKSLPALWQGILRPQYGGYIINIINQMYENDDSNLLIHNVLRLFRRLPGVYFEGKVHEQVVPSLERQGYTRPKLDGMILHHYGYVNSVVVEKDKSNRTLNILLEELNQNPKDYFHWFNIATIYFYEKEWKKCVEASEKSIQYLPNWPPFVGMLYYNWSISYIELGEFNKVLEICQDFDEKNNGFIPMINYVKALAYFQLDQKEKALKYVDLSLQQDENVTLDQNHSVTNFMAPFLKGQILYSLQRFEDSVQVFKETLVRKPDLKEAIYFRGVACTKIKDYASGLSDFLTLSKETSYVDKVKPLIALCYFKIDQAKNGVEWLRSISKDFILSEELLTYWFDHIQREDKVEEIQYRFAQIADCSAKLRINYGRALLHFGLYHLAEEQFKNVVIEDESNTNGWFNLGDLYLKLEKYEGSKICYEHGLSLEKNNLDGWLNLGNCFYSLNQPLKAIDCYEQILRRCPDHYAALQNLQVVCDTLKAS